MADVVEHNITTTRRADGEYASVCSCGASWSLKSSATPHDITEKAVAHAQYNKPAACND